MICDSKQKVQIRPLCPSEKDCREVVGLFEKLAVKNDCKRKFDKDPVPSFALTMIAKKAFNKQIVSLVDESRPPSELPKLTKMYFSKKPEDFREVSVSLTAHTYIKMKAKDLPVVVEWFVKTMYHPALGNKVFKIYLRP